MSLFGRVSRTVRFCRIVRNLCATAEVAHIPDEPHQAFRTIENNPVNHRLEHLHRFYTVPTDLQGQLYRYGGLPKKFNQQVETFMECCFLVRSPAVELISYLNQMDYTRPANKYVLYGEVGTGKSLTLAHILHYAAMTKKIIVHVPWVPYWFVYPKEFAASQTREGYFDLPLHGAAWLVHFKHQNSSLLSELDIRVSKEYKWSPRETTNSGAPLMQLVDLGISRLKYACDVIYALTDELKLASTNGKCSTLVAIDGFNSFYTKKSQIKNDEKKMVMPIDVSLTAAFLNMTKYDWCNGAIVLTVDTRATTLIDKMSPLPRYLLGKEGFEHLDPFLPIQVENYTPEEFDTVIDYYKDRKWIRNITKEGQRELELLTVRNPYNIMHHATYL